MSAGLELQGRRSGQQSPEERLLLRREPADPLRCLRLLRHKSVRCTEPDALRAGSAPGSARRNHAVADAMSLLISVLYVPVTTVPGCAAVARVPTLSASRTVRMAVACLADARATRRSITAMTSPVAETWRIHRRVDRFCTVGQNHARGDANECRSKYSESSAAN